MAIALPFESGERFIMEKFKEIIEGKNLVLVDYFSTWCGPCKMMHPVLEELKRHFGDRLKILKVDIDNPNNRRFVSTYQVQAVPTLRLFKEGKLVWRQSGALPVNELRNIVEKYL